MVPTLLENRESAQMGPSSIVDDGREFDKHFERPAVQTHSAETPQQRETTEKYNTGNFTDSYSDFF